VELFRGINVDWLGKKWYFLGFSLIFSVAGVLSMAFWHHIPLGVDFKGGTLVYVKFANPPDNAQLRSATDKAGIHDARIQSFGPAANHEVIISLPQSETSESALDAGRAKIVATLEANYAASGQDASNTSKLDLDNASREQIATLLTTADPLHDGNAQHYTDLANAIAHYRDVEKSGLVPSINDLSAVAPAPVVAALNQSAFISGFTIRNVEIVGPQVGAQLKKQAALATLYSLLGMLIYLWFRFELIYGVAAVVAVFHDTLITVGFFSLTNREISLTVVAAILTLIGYSMNDTIVVFDRIRENLRMRRRDALPDVVNRSINQTMSRTILTSGLTFLTVLCLYLFGGEVLRNFSFALVVGILIGTYSSIAVAAPMLVAYQQWRAKKGKSIQLPAAKRARA
jgi:preprotein translocase subunit SecF